MASHGCGANRNVGRSGPRPPGLMAWRGQSLQAPVSHCREPASWVRIRKPPRWSAERGPGRPGTGGRASQARPKNECGLSALHPPLIGGTGLLLSRRPPVPNSPADAQAKAHAKRRTNPDAATRRGNEETTLFDIVKRIPTTAHARAAMSRAGCAPAHVSRASERQRAKTRDPGASRQNRWTVQTSRMSPLGPGSRFARPGHELTAQSRATASPSRSPARRGRSNGSRRNRRRRRRGSRTR